jgi:hypothetical protein
MDEVGLLMENEPITVLVENKLGISVHELKPLFKYSISELNNLLRSNPNKLLWQSVDIIEKFNQLTRAILIIRGDMPVALNIRKYLIENTHLDYLYELDFMKIVLLRNPKSPSAWYHRRWCLSKLLLQKYNLFLDLEFMNNELQLCEYLCDIYPKNYYGWIQRLWLLQYMNTTQVIFIYIYLAYIFHYITTNCIHSSNIYIYNIYIVRK